MSKKILLVEDEAIIAMSEAEMLKKHGYEVYPVYSGEKALEAVEADPEISLILMDIDLGEGIDGTETAHEILKKHDLPIAFLSSHTEPALVEKTEGITSYGYIVKNSGETVIIAAIKMAFRLFEAKMKEKEHKEALLHSHNLMSYIIEHNQSAVAVHDKNLKYIYVSQQYLNQYNVRKRDVIGKHHYQVFPDLPQKWRDVHQRALEGEVSRGENDPYEREDGTVEWTRWECRPWYEGDGSIGGLIIYTEVFTKEKQSHADIRDTVNYLQSILRTTRDGFWVLDSGGNFIDVNNAYCEMSGYSRDEILHMKIPDIDADEKQEDAAERMKRIISTGSEIFQVRHRRKDGTLFDVEISASFLGGSRDKIICFCRDITERKKTEAALQKSEKKYKSLYNNLRDAIIVVNKKREITDCNTAFTDLFGYSLSEIEGKTTSMLYASSEDYEALGKMMEEQEDDSNFIYQTRYRKKSGEIIQGEKKIQYLLDEEGNPEGFIGLIRDISERKKLEKDLIESEEKFRLFVETAPIGIIILDQNERVLYLNKKFESLFGYTMDDIPSVQEWWEAAYPDKEFRKKVQEIWKKNTQYAIEHHTEISPLQFPVNCKDGRVVEIEFHFASSGNLNAVIFLDVTKQKKAEEEIEKQLSEKKALLKEVHHRIKNHMATISSIISLRGDHISDAQTSEILGEIKRKIDLMHNIYQALYTGEDVGTIDISSFLDPLIQDIRSTYIDTREVSIDSEYEDIKVTAKQSLPIGIITTELITNSIKYAFPEGSPGKIKVSLCKEDPDHLCIEVADNGKGTPSETAEQGAYGFGLTLVDTYAVQYNGTLNISNDRGTTVRVTLELEKPQDVE